MENISKNDKTFYISSFLNNNKGANYEDYINNINKREINVNNNINNNEICKNENMPIMNMNSLYTNMMRFDLLGGNINNCRPINYRINSLLIDFNKELSKENMQKNKNNIEKNINKQNKNNFEPLIKKLESQEDERFKNSRFLQFIKDINSNKLIINEEKNIIEQNNNKNEDDNKEKENDENELEVLLNEAEMYMNYSREDLAQNILERIFDNAKIKLKENKKYLEKAYILLILSYFNENENLLGISLIIDFLKIINIDNNNYKYLYNEKIISKEYIEKINQRDFDITDKSQYNNYLINKKKIHEEIENYLDNIIINNENQNYNKVLLLLYGLILYLNEKYKEAEDAFNKLIILDKNNYFYYNILGVIFSNQKRYEDSLRSYKKAIEINAKYPKCLINLSVLLYNKGEFKESSKYLILALKIFDDIPEGWNYLLSNIIELNEDDLICEINNRNLKNIEEIIFKK